MSDENDEPDQWGAAAREALWGLLGRRVSLAEHSRAGVAVFHHYVAAGINHPELARLLAKVKAEATDGRHERFKSTIDFDGPYHRQQHGFAV